VLLEIIEAMLKYDINNISFDNFLEEMTNLHFVRQQDHQPKNWFFCCSNVSYRRSSNRDCHSSFDFPKDISVKLPAGDN
jgi:hypothetical protein